jgi:acetyl-CoA acetyltransferase
MSNPVILEAARTAVGTANKTLAYTPAEELAVAVLTETVRRSGLNPQRLEDVIFAGSV